MKKKRRWSSNQQLLVNSIIKILPVAGVPVDWNVDLTIGITITGVDGKMTVRDTIKHATLVKYKASSFS
jgi:hypothetical protein